MQFLYSFLLLTIIRSTLPVNAPCIWHSLCHFCQVTLSLCTSCASEMAVWWIFFHSELPFQQNPGGVQFMCIFVLSFDSKNVRKIYYFSAESTHWINISSLLWKRANIFMISVLFCTFYARILWSEILRVLLSFISFCRLVLIRQNIHILCKLILSFLFFFPLLTLAHPGEKYALLPLQFSL